jgi:hypothetical protein
VRSARPAAAGNRPEAGPTQDPEVHRQQAQQQQQGRKRTC